MNFLIAPLVVIILAAYLLILSHNIEFLHQNSLYRCHRTLCEVFRILGIDQCFSTAGPRTGTGPWHQLHRAARDSPGICHF